MEIEDYGPLLTAEAFLEIDFGERIKAELDEGRVAPLVRGPEKRVRAATNLACLVRTATRGTGFSSYGSTLMVQTGRRSVRFPDVAVYARSQRAIANEGDRDLMADPLLVIHVRVMSASETGRLLAEYKTGTAMQAIMLVDHESEAVRLVQRTKTDAWVEELIGEGGEAAFHCLGLTIPHAEIFARD